MSCELILGGVRSGKSRYAQQRAEDSGCDVIYLATARSGDDEMQRRIDRHRQERPDAWQTLEVPVGLGDALQTHAAAGRLILVDCLTLWLSQILFDSRGNLTETVFAREMNALEEFLRSPRGTVLFVSNEVGLGVIGATPETRLYVDEAGRLNQLVASWCQRVVLVTAGIPRTIKGEV